MTLTDDFLTDTEVGFPPPGGWVSSFPANSGGDTATVQVQDSCAVITAPTGVNRDSIFTTGGTDLSAGIVHALTDHGGLLDIAIQVDTDITDKGGAGVTLLFTGSGTDAFRATWYKNTTITNWNCHVFMYARAGGVGAQIVNNSLQTFMSGHPAWLRVTYDPITGTWTTIHASDGFTWITRASGVRAFTATSLKVSVVSAVATPTFTARINQVVDLLEVGTTDLRDLNLLARDRRVISTIDGAASQLPSDWVDESFGGSSITFTGSALRLTDIGNLVTPGGTSARIRYTGDKVVEFGMLLRASSPVSNSSCFFTPGFTNATQQTDDNDQYTYKGGMAQEIQCAGGVNAIRRPIRVDDPTDGNVSMDPALSSTGLDETPYCWLKDLTGLSMTGVEISWRFERVRTEAGHLRYRAKWWLSSEAEPSTWNMYDGQEETNDFPLGPYATLSRNALNDTPGSVDILELQYYELVEPSSMDFEPILVGSGSLNDQIMAGLVSQGFTSGSIADRERGRLLAKLELSPLVTGLSLYDLYRQADEVPRIT